MIKWLKNLLGLNGFSDGGFTGRGHVSAMLSADNAAPTVPSPRTKDAS